MLGILISLFAVLAVLGFAFHADSGKRRNHHEWLEMLRNSPEQAAANSLLTRWERAHRA